MSSLWVRVSSGAVWEWKVRNVHKSIPNSQGLVAQLLRMWTHFLFEHLSMASLNHKVDCEVKLAQSTGGWRDLFKPGPGWERSLLVGGRCTFTATGWQLVFGKGQEWKARVSTVVWGVTKSLQRTQSICSYTSSGCLLSQCQTCVCFHQFMMKSEFRWVLRLQIGSWSNGRIDLVK